MSAPQIEAKVIAVIKPKGADAPDATTEATNSLTPELVVALCGPIGSPLHEAANQIANCLSDFGYTTRKVRLSNLIRQNSEKVGVLVSTASKYHETKSLIEAGDKLREKFGNDVLAKIAIATIAGDRTKQFGDFHDEVDESQVVEKRRVKFHRVCHVIDSIKNDAELELLRLIYGDALLAIGIFSPVEVRRRNMLRPRSFAPEEIDLLIDQDSGEEFSHGQSVRDTFPKCDVFVRIDYPVVAPTEEKAVAQLVEKLRRFFNLLLHASIVTPTHEETAMYAAASAARNSACLSRQVGAAVASASGELLGIGWNDVPRGGGGLYGKPPVRPLLDQLGPPADSDQRCYALEGGVCFNDQEKKVISELIAKSLVDAGLLEKTFVERAASAISNDSRVKDLIEFSRAVHAEMHAILGASRVAGDRVVGGRLYVTTYPCHSCARHIVAAGIVEVYYIEPYRKSLATRLHADSLTESVDQLGKVRLLQYDGVAPRRFIDLFQAGTRKAGGVLRLEPRMKAIPSTHVSLKAIPRLEEVVIAEMVAKELNLPDLTIDEAQP